MAIITADHGNCDEMFELDKKTGEPVRGEDGRLKAKTSHTLNAVPCYVYTPRNDALSLDEEVRQIFLHART